MHGVGSVQGVVAVGASEGCGVARDIRSRELCEVVIRATEASGVHSDSRSGMWGEEASGSEETHGGGKASPTGVQTPQGEMRTSGWGLGSVVEGGRVGSRDGGGGRSGIDILSCNAVEARPAVASGNEERGSGGSSGEAVVGVLTEQEQIIHRGLDTVTGGAPAGLETQGGDIGLQVGGAGDGEREHGWLVRSAAEGEQAGVEPAGGLGGQGIGSLGPTAAADARNQLWASRAKRPSRGRLSLRKCTFKSVGGSRQTSGRNATTTMGRRAETRYLEGSGRTVQRCGRDHQAVNLLRAAERRLDAALSPEMRAKAKASRRAALARRARATEEREDDLLRDLDWDALEAAALASGGAAAMGAAESNGEECAVCDRGLGELAEEANFTLCCGNCKLLLHASCYYSPAVLADGRVRDWQVSGRWICGMCVQGEVIGSSMEVQASGGLELEGDPQSGGGGLEGREISTRVVRRRSRGDGFLTGPGLWQGGGVVSAALDFTAVFKGMPTVYPSSCKCARCDALTKTRRCGSCGWDTTVVVKSPLELRDLINGRHSWAAEPRFCVVCDAWRPWKCWSPEAGVWAGRLISALQRCSDLESLLGRAQVRPDDQEAAKEWAARRAGILEGVLEFVRACMTLHRRRLGCESAELRRRRRGGGGSALRAGPLAATARGVGGSVVPRGLENVGGSCGVAVVVQLLRACTSAREVIDQAHSDSSGSSIWGPLSQLFADMDAGDSVGHSLTALIQSWCEEGVLTEFDGGVDPAQVLFRLLQQPGKVGRGLRRLVDFRTSTWSVCADCQVWKEDVRTEHSLVACQGYRSLQRQIDNPHLGSRTCACGGVRQGQSHSWTGVGEVFIVQGACRLDAVSTTLGVRVGVQTVELALVAVFEDSGPHHLLHLRGSAAADGEVEWLTLDDGLVTSLVRTSRADEGVFMRGAAHRRSTLWVYARLVQERAHAMNVGLVHPCLSDCGVTDCSNRAERGNVKVDTCSWLPGQRGLFAKVNLRAGAWVARFDVGLTATTSSEAQSGGTFFMQVRLSRGRGSGTMRAVVPLGLGAAMAANSTCCRKHQNAEIVQDTDDHVWIRLVADVTSDEEILVSYGADFFANAECACCLCSGRCRYQADIHATGACTGRR